MQIEAILEKNNLGVEHLCKGHYSASKKAFRAAILKLREFYQEQRSEDCFRFCSLIIEPRSIPFSQKLQSKSSTHYIYRNALIASVEVNPQIEEDHLCTDLTAMIIFNLCLVHECSTEQYESRSDKSKLLRLYKKAWDALRRDSLHHDTIALGILNNMGAIFHDLGKYQQAQHCFRALKSSLSSKSVVVQTLNNDARNGIILNVLFLDEPTTAIAA